MTAPEPARADPPDAAPAPAAAPPATLVGMLLASDMSDRPRRVDILACVEAPAGDPTARRWRVGAACAPLVTPALEALGDDGVRHALVAPAPDGSLPMDVGASRFLVVPAELASQVWLVEADRVRRLGGAAAAGEATIEVRPIAGPAVSAATRLGKEELMAPRADVEAHHALDLQGDGVRDALLLVAGYEPTLGHGGGEQWTETGVYFADGRAPSEPVLLWSGPVYHPVIVVSDLDGDGVRELVANPLCFVRVSEAGVTMHAAGSRARDCPSPSVVIWPRDWPSAKTPAGP